MQILQLLLFFLYSDIDRVVPTIQYKYQIYKEVRYIKGSFSHINVSTNNEHINITIKKDVIDLNNYYPLDSLIITGQFDYLFFYQDKVKCAVVTDQNKDSYNINDYVLLNGHWYHVILSYQIPESKIIKLISINKTIDQKEPLYTNIS